MCLILRDLSIGFEGRALSSNINFEFKKGFNLIVAPSGTGKTTLLKTICLMVKPIKGDIEYQGKSILSVKFEWSKKCIMLKQGKFYMEETPIDTIKSPFKFRAHKDKKLNKELMFDLLKKFNMYEDVLYEKSEKLSGGQKQRIALIRSILLEPEVFLLDEPTTGLDDETADNVYAFLNDFCKERICLFASHDINARKFTEIVLDLSNRVSND